MQGEMFNRFHGLSPAHKKALVTVKERGQFVMSELSASLNHQRVVRLYCWCPAKTEVRVWRIVQSFECFDGLVEL